MPFHREPFYIGDKENAVLSWWHHTAAGSVSVTAGAHTATHSASAHSLA